MDNNSKSVLVKFLPGCQENSFLRIESMFSMLSPGHHPALKSESVPMLLVRIALTFCSAFTAIFESVLEYQRCS